MFSKKSYDPLFFFVVCFILEIFSPLFIFSFNIMLFHLVAPILLTLSAVNSYTFPSFVRTRRNASSTTQRIGTSLGIFGSGSGPKITYQNLRPPADEIASSAMSKQVPSLSASGDSIATFAGGCFWGLELAYQRVEGVTGTAVGYTQGQVDMPDYGAVCSGGTGHTEAVQVFFDEKVVTYDQLLDVFFSRVDPTTVNGQGNDFGTQYRTGVYTHTDAQAKLAADRFAAVGANLGKNFLGQPKKMASELKVIETRNNLHHPSADLQTNPTLHSTDC